MSPELYAVYVDGNDINAVPGFEVLNHSFNDLPERNIRMNEIARADKSIITSADYTQKQVIIEGEACGGNRTETEGVLTFLKSLVQRINSDVKVLQSNSEYSYTATLNEFNIRWDGATAIVQIGFVASDPIGYETSTTQLLNENITVRNATFTRVIEGSFRAQPTFNITINSLTGGTGGSISIMNTNTGQGITVSADYVAGDLLTIDTAQKIATINGTQVDFTGIFPTYAAGSRGFGYSDNFSARNVDLTATYIKRIV